MAFKSKPKISSPLAKAPKVAPLFTTKPDKMPLALRQAAMAHKKYTG